MAKVPKKKADYDSGSIQVLTVTEAIRKNPSMFVGGSDWKGVNHCAYEIIGNGLDEVAAKHATSIDIHVSADLKTVTVSDDGRGIPVGPHPKLKTDTLTIVFTEMNAGGKFDAKAYKTSLGVHGQGASIVNALSTSLRAWSFRKGWWHQAFKDGKPVKAKPEKAQVKFVPTPFKKGTVVEFTLGLDVFDKGSKLNLKALRAWLDDISWLIPAEITLTVGDGKAEKFHRPDGLKQRYLNDCAALKAEPFTETPFLANTAEVDMMVGWCGSADSYIYSAVNSVETTEHGTHYNAMLECVQDALKAHMKRSDVVSKEALRTGLVCVINVRMHHAKYSSQSKERLTSTEVKPLIATAMMEGKNSFAAYLKKNKALARQIIDRANEITRLTSTFKADLKLGAAVKAEKKGKLILPEGMKDSRTDNPEERELFIVEGLSALSGCVPARDPQFQEILPLTGKLPNVWKLEAKTFTNPRVLDILKAVGFDPKNPQARRVGRIILLLDADVDGEHGSALLLGLIQKVLPDMLAEGRVFLVDAPLFTYRTDKDLFQAATANALRKLVEGEGLKFEQNKVVRLKGWGEAGKKTMEEVAFDVTKRTLKQVTPLVTAEHMRSLTGLLGEDVAFRKNLLGV